MVVVEAAEPLPGGACWILLLAWLPGHATGGHPSTTSSHEAAAILVREWPRGQDCAAKIGVTRVARHDHSYLSTAQNGLLFACLLLASHAANRKTKVVAAAFLLWRLT